MSSKSPWPTCDGNPDQQLLVAILEEHRPTLEYAALSKRLTGNRTGEAVRQHLIKLRRTVGEKLENIDPTPNDEDEEAAAVPKKHKRKPKTIKGSILTELEHLDENKESKPSKEKSKPARKRFQADG
ncbi:MAG: hypothetical protein MMC33_005661 [Icmadophila ericetorum]|nr:hypothetical protein [Icmadophila ericetorum]